MCNPHLWGLHTLKYYFSDSLMGYTVVSFDPERKMKRTRPPLLILAWLVLFNRLQFKPANPTISTDALTSAAGENHPGDYRRPGDHPGTRGDYSPAAHPVWRADAHGKHNG